MENKENLLEVNSMIIFNMFLKPKFSEGHWSKVDKVSWVWKGLASPGTRSFNLVFRITFVFALLALWVFRYGREHPRPFNLLLDLHKEYLNLDSCRHCVHKNKSNTVME